MKIKYKLAVGLTLLSLGFMGQVKADDKTTINDNAAATPTTKETSTFSDPAKAIIVSKSSPHFTIRLKSNPTTGYSWYLKDYDSGYTILRNHNFQAPTKKMMGAPGVETWTFNVASKAFTTPQVLKVEFVYIRPWDLHDNPSRAEFTILTK